MSLTTLAVALINIGSIDAAQALFLASYPAKDHFLLRLLPYAALSMLVAGANMLLSTMPGGMRLAGQILSFSAFLLLSIPSARMAFSLNWWDSAFACSAGYMLQNLAFSTYQLVYLLLAGTGIEAPLALALQGAITAAVYALGWFVLCRRVRQLELAGEVDRRVFAAVILAMLFNIALDAVNQMLAGEAPTTLALAVVSRTSHVFICLITIALVFEVLYNSRLHAENATVREMMRAQARQYEISRETIDAMNANIHDIKHEINQVRQDATPESLQILDVVSRKVDSCDVGVRTGDEALDTILAQKRLLCSQQGIELICMAEGNAVSFMSEADVYALFGNILDNAIAAVGKIEELQGRTVNLKVHRVGGMVVIHEENYYQGTLSYRNGMPVSEQEGEGHGIGLRSIRLTAERYEGAVTVDAQDDVFSITVLIPIPS